MSATEKPVKDAITLLEADHRAVALMFKKFDELESPVERVALIESIVRELSVHATAEEKHLYPLLAKDDTMHTIEEHHTIKLLLAEISDMKGDEPNIKPKLQVLGELVAHHVTEEEGHLFDELRKLNADLIKLGQDLANEKEFLLSHITSIGNKDGAQMGGSPRVSI